MKNRDVELINQILAGDRRTEAKTRKSKLNACAGRLAARPSYSSRPSYS